MVYGIEVFGKVEIHQGMPYGIPVRQAGNLPPVSFRFLLTGDTLAIG
jgi:hypothetical protein